MPNDPNKAPLSAEKIKQLEEVRQDEPCHLFARRFGISGMSVTRALAGLPLYRGTRTVIESRLREMTQSA